MTLSFRVANSLTGKMIGRLYPTEWEWTENLVGQDEISLKIPLPADAMKVEHLHDLLQPQIRQVVILDGDGNFWTGGPILSDPELEGDVLTVPCADWRAWFYAAPIRPFESGARRDYLHGPDDPVEQCLAVAELAEIGLDVVGAPRIVVDAPPDSEILREVTHRMFQMSGAAMDNVCQRERGPEWWTYMAADPADPTSVVGHVAVGFPERRRSASGLTFRHKVLRHERGQGGNILTYKWPKGTVPISRVFGVGPTPPPAEEWAVAEDPALAEGDRLAWDEVWQLPDGVTTPDSAFEHALARLQAHGQALGAVEASIDPNATDLAQWGAGDRARLVVSDGWRDVDLPAVRVLSRRIAGRGGHVLSVDVTLNLSEIGEDIDDPVEVAEES